MRRSKVIALVTITSILSMAFALTGYAIWFAGYESLTQQYIYNSFEIRKTQEQLIQNHQQSYRVLANCIVNETRSCHLEQALVDMQGIVTERQQLQDKLNELSRETERILTEMKNH